MNPVYLGKWHDIVGQGYAGRARGLAAAPSISPQMSPGYAPYGGYPPYGGYDGRYAYDTGEMGRRYGGRAADVRAVHPWASSAMGAAIGHWQEFAPSPMGPGGVLVDAPPPTRANRDILPMSTGVPILPTQSAQITGRPQTMVFSINRFLISNAGTAGGAADWIVNDIKIGNRSQFVQSGDVPGDLFATNAIDTFVRFDTAQTAMDVVVVVTYIGLNECGAPFFGAMVGTAAV